LDESAYYGEVLADNAGSRSTGADRVTAHLVLNSPAGWGDALSANLLHSSGSDYARLGYTVPVGVDGWRAGINASTMRYSVFTHTASGTSKTQGSSDSAGLEANLPLVRSRQRNLYLSLAAEQKAFQTHIVAAGGSDTLYSDYRTNNFSLGLSGNLFDVWGGGGANSASLSVQHGQLASVLAGSPQVSMAPRYTLWRWGLTRQQTVTDAHALYLSLSGQMADKDIDTSERLYLGGMSGVRAYPASEIGGAGGQLVNLEWRWRVDPSLTLVSFYDWGRAKSPGEATATVRGAGLGVGWQNPSGVYIKATWARRIGHNPRADSVTGMDGDGTLQTDRWWLSASLPF
jgi:hemolysin activation/secretion protein